MKGEDHSVGDSEVCLKPITEHATKPTIRFLKQITWGIIKQKKICFQENYNYFTCRTSGKVHGNCEWVANGKQHEDSF